MGAMIISYQAINATPKKAVMLKPLSMISLTLVGYIEKGVKNAWGPSFEEYRNTVKHMLPLYDRMKVIHYIFWKFNSTCPAVSNCCLLV